MTRGKYAARAENRRTDAQIEATAASHLRQIHDLTEERDDARRRLAEERKDHAQQTRVLRAQRDEALSPELQARNLMITDLKRKLADMTSLRNRGQASQDKLVGWVIDHLHRGHKLTKFEAIEQITKLITTNEITFDPDQLGHGDKDVEMVRKVQRARGERH